MRYVIIGSSAAGIKASETLRGLDKDAAITVVSEENEHPYSRCLLPEYLAGARSRGELRFKPARFFEQHNIHALPGEKVVSVEPEKQRLRFENGGVLNFDKLLVATGASSTCPPLPGIDQVGSMGLRNLGDADRILSQARAGRKAVIIGGGFVGLEAAYALNRRGLEVTVVEMAPHILALQLDAAAAAILTRDMEQVGIKILAGTTASEVRPASILDRARGNRENTVVLGDGTELKAHLILTCTGTKPNTELLAGTAIKINRGIVVNEFMETTVPGIYAAGDVCESTDLASGQPDLTPIWPNAVTQGKAAAMNMAGKAWKASPLLGMQNAVEFREVPAIAVGLSTALPGPDLETLTSHHPERGFYRKIVLKDNIIKGIIFVGDIQNAGVAAALIRKQADVSRVKHKLLERNFNYGYLWPSRDLQAEEEAAAKVTA